MNPIPSKSPLALFVRRLCLHTALSREDAEAILELPFRCVTRERHSFVMRQGDDLPFVSILVSGVVERHRISQNGSKQVLYFYLPGDPLNLESLFAISSDDAIQLIRPSELAIIKTSDLSKLMRERPSVMDAIVRSLLVDASAFREWIFNVGQRDARARIAHLLCELGLRIRAPELGGERLLVPLTQMNIAEATGLTPIHVNRMLRALQAESLISYKSGFIKLLDWQRLTDVADFSASYLHLNKMSDLNGFQRSGSSGDTDGAA